MEHFEAEFEEAFLRGAGDANDTEFFGLIVERVENFENGAESGTNGGADQRADAANGDSFGRGLDVLAGGVVANDINGNANEETAGAAAFEHG